MTADEAIAAYEGLVRKLAGEFVAGWTRWRRHGVEADDFEQVGRLAVAEVAAKCPHLAGFAFARLAACVARRRMTDHLRALISQVRHTRGSEGLLSPHVSLDGGMLADPRPGPAAGDDAGAELLAAARPLTLGLSARERDVVRLYFGRGLTVRACAEALGVSPARVCGLLQDVLAHSRRRAEDLGGERAVRGLVLGGERC